MDQKYSNNFIWCTNKVQSANKIFLCKVWKARMTRAHNYSKIHIFEKAVTMNGL